MKYAVVGGDVRFAHLARMLAEGGRDAQGFLQQGTNQDVAQLADYDCVLSRWPMDRCDEVMRAIPSGAMLLLCGKGREGYQLVQGKKIPYDEEETVRSCARELLESRPQAL